MVNSWRLSIKKGILKNNIELLMSVNIFKKLIQRYCTIYSLKDTLFHKIAFETDVSLKQNRLSLVYSQIFSSML